MTRTNAQLHGSRSAARRVAADAAHDAYEELHEAREARRVAADAARDAAEKLRQARAALAAAMRAEAAAHEAWMGREEAARFGGEE